MVTIKHKYFSDFARKHYSDGWAAGLAESTTQAAGELLREALLSVLAARELALSEDDRARVNACSDVATLDKWLHRAVTATATNEVFEDAFN